MLQQTTVSTVQNKLPSILKEFPDFKSFKSKKIDDFLKCWSGLGYYNRAINFYNELNFTEISQNARMPEYPFFGSLSWTFFWKLSFLDKEYFGRIFYLLILHNF